MKFWEVSDRAMESFDFQSWSRFTRDALNLGQEAKAKDVHSFVCRFGNFSVDVRTQLSSVGIGEDRSPLNPNAKLFRKPTECMKKQGAKDLKDSIGKSRLENSTGKGEARVCHEFKQKLFRMRAQVKEIQDKLDGKENLDQ